MPENFAISKIDTDDNYNIEQPSIDFIKIMMEKAKFHSNHNA